MGELLDVSKININDKELMAVSAEGLTFKTDTTNFQTNGYLDIEDRVQRLSILYNVSFSFNFIHLSTMAKSKFEEM